MKPERKKLRPRKPKPVMPSTPEEVFRSLFRAADRKLVERATAQEARNGK